jgi:mannose-1-phosphate guanylyltransferase
MRAILLSAGIGKRLRPITKKIPKCLVKVKKKPIIDIWIDELVEKNKIKSILINTHYLSQKVYSHVKKNKYKKKIKLIYEDQLYGTAGTLINNLDFFKNEEGLLIHCDNYCEEGLKNFIKSFKAMPKNCLMSMLTFRTKKPEKCGIVKINKKNIVVKFQEKKRTNLGNLANGAIYILSKKLIKILKNKNKTVDNFSTQIIPKMINKIYTYETKAFFIDIGTLGNLKKANKHL